ncbi:MAG: TIR domain-containing protein [Acidimicrobiia bacterium]
MKIFISYARRDAASVELLHADLEQAKHEPWYDRNLDGGQRWWDALVGQIRGCQLFLFVLSPESLRSRACRAELAYAVATHRPVLPVMVRDVNIELAPDPIGVTHIVDQRERTPASAIALLTAIAQLPTPPPVPDPPPPPPPPPVTDLGPVRERLSADVLDLAGQQALFADLVTHADNIDQQATVRGLLTMLRDRSDVAASVAREADALLATLPLDDDTNGDDAPVRPRRPLSERDPDSVDRLRSLVTHIRSDHFTPITGNGLAASLIGSRRHLAREWSRSFEFPMEKHHQDNLPEVARFIAVMTNTDTLRSSLHDYLRDRLHARLAAGSTAAAASDSLGQVMRAAWDEHRAPDDAFVVLASLPCRIYVCAHPWDLQSESLRMAGKDPVTEVCRWRPDVYDWPPSIFESEPGFVPSVERPLVYHVFGHLDVPESLVITEDDYDDFLVGITENRALIPPPVQRALADSALLLLGFELEERDVRVLLRTLVSQEGAQKLNKYTHVAAQLDLRDGVVSPQRAQRYLERYFAKFRQPSIDIFWGSVDEFAADLAEIWGMPR